MASDDVITAFVIGDPHFKHGNISESEEFVIRSVEECGKVHPTIIVILGDTLDTHEIVRTQPYNLACRWIDELSRIAPVYLLIGNHDLINATQFLTTAHCFNPLKKWKNVTVVDRPVYAEHDNISFVFCPYVEPGRFTEALDKLIEDGESWQLSDCIFAHQEFRGCKMGAIISEKGDIWDENYPPVISGHIHDSQTVGTNVYYPGSSIQHAFGESPNKCVWHIKFDAEDEPFFSIDKIPLGMKSKKIMYMSVEDTDTFDENILEKHHVKLSIKGTPEELTVFRSGKVYSDLRKKGVKFAFTKTQNEIEETGEKKNRDEVSFLESLKKVVKTKSDPVQKLYTEIVGTITDSSEEGSTDTSEEECELIFLDSDEE